MFIVSKFNAQWIITSSDEFNSNLDKKGILNEVIKIHYLATDENPLTRYLSPNVVIPANDSVAVEFGFNARILYVYLSSPAEIVVNFHTVSTQAVHPETKVLHLEGNGYESLDFVNSYPTSDITGQVVVLGDDIIPQPSSSS